MCVYLQTILETVTTVKGGLSEGTKKVFQAFAKDIDKMDQRIKSIDSDVQIMKNDVSNVKNDISNVKNDISNVKTDISNVKSNISELNGKMDTVIELIESGIISNNSNNSSDHHDKVIGSAVNNILKSKKFWIVLGVSIAIIMLSGVSIMYILEHANDVATVTDAASKLL